MVTKLIKVIRNPSDFLRSLIVLVTGTVAAQLIMLLALPVLTRLYAPEDFSALAVYASLLSILSVAACLGLDLAVSMPESDEESGNLLILAIIFAALTSIVISLVLYFFDTKMLIRVGLEKLLPFLWMIPVGIFISAAYSAIQFYAIRKKSFIHITKAKIGQSSAAASSQIGLGIYGVTPFGLLFGQMLSGGIGFLHLFLILINRSILSSISFNSLKTVLIKYKNFPQFTTLETLTNSAGIQIPIILIATLTVGPEAGFLFLAMKVMQAPMSLVGRAISQVYLANAPQENSNGNLAAFTEKILNGLIKVGVGPIIFAGIIAPLAFAIAFGAEWQRSGLLVFWMTPWFVFQFLASPISMAMHVKNKQRLMLLITISGFILRVGTLLLVSLLSKNVLSECYAVSGGIFYFLCFFVFSMCAGLTAKKLVLLLFIHYKYIVPWVLFAIFLKQMYFLIFGSFE